MVFPGSTKTVFVAPHNNSFHFPWRLPLAAGSIFIICLIVFVVVHMTQRSVVVKTVLAAQTLDTIHFLPTVTPLPTQYPLSISHTIFIQGPLLTPVPVASEYTLPKKSYSIAIIGDSMVDTMGERLEYLEHSLKRKYPTAQFTLYNYGIGGQNVEEGLARFSSPFQFRDRTYPAIAQVHPDYLVVASFAYNPFNPYDRNKHWLLLDRLVKEAEKASSHVYVLAEIAPLIADFGKGPGGVNWPDPTIHAHHIIEQLENAEGVAQSEHVGLIDAFAASQVNKDKAGNKTYVNTNDNIHPSVAGHEFIANLITDTIRF